jgi:hypothetical protein
MPQPCSGKPCVCPATSPNGPLAYDLCFNEAENKLAISISDFQQKIIIVVLLLAM